MATPLQALRPLGAFELGMPPQPPVVNVESTPVSLADGVFAITQSLHEYKVRRLPVVDEEGRLTGIFTVDHLLRLIASEFSNRLQSIEPEMALRF